MMRVFFGTKQDFIIKTGVLCFKRGSFIYKNCFMDFFDFL
jgi:hypothetical protein